MESFDVEDSKVRLSSKMDIRGCADGHFSASPSYIRSQRTQPFCQLCLPSDASVTATIQRTDEPETISLRARDNAIHGVILVIEHSLVFDCKGANNQNVDSLAKESPLLLRSSHNLCTRRCLIIATHYYRPLPSLDLSSF